jgi:hypothetical protein
MLMLDSTSPPFTSPQPDRLPVLLQLCDQPITLLNHISVLLVLVIGTIRLDDPVDTVDGAWNAICGDEFC